MLTIAVMMRTSDAKMLTGASMTVMKIRTIVTMTVTMTLMIAVTVIIALTMTVTCPNWGQHR